MLQLPRRVRPLVGQLGQDGEAGPQVLPPLRVVGRERGHPPRRHLLAARRGGVERGDVEAELPRVRSHLVEADEPGVAVEGRVLHALGHHGARELLEAHAQLVGRIAQPGQQQLDGGRQVRPGAPHGVHRVRQVRRALGQIRAVDGKRHDELGQRGDGIGDGGDQSSQSTELRLQNGGGHVALPRRGVLVPVGLVTGQLAVDAVEARFRRRIDRGPR